MRALYGIVMFAAACGGGNTGGGIDTGSGPYFPSGSFFYEDISGVAPVSNSDAITANMEAQHGPNGWGTGEMRIDFSIVVNRSDGTGKQAFTIDEDYYYPPECDHTQVPLPAGGAVEVDWENPPDLSGLAGYECTSFDDGGDCHLLVFSPSEDRLYEIYHSTVRGGGEFIGGCEALWETSAPPPITGRGQQCTSADAAGYPIAPLLVTPEEVQDAVDGVKPISHAVRLILPNDIIRADVYFSPATHGTNTTGSQDTLPYGGRMRLRADYPVDDLPPAAAAIARAMQTYGLLLADGGSIALTMSSDVLSTVTWEALGLDSFAFTELRASDFDVIIAGDPIVTGSTECDRTPIED